MPNKLMVIMIDGVSADYFATCRGRLPHLSALADRGLVVNNLHSEVLGTSLPGRTSMMTGFTADISGVYGNKIWNGKEFMYATPDVVRVPTLPARAKAAGLDVAVIGFGMIRPEDAAIFKPPWWVGEMIQRARDAEPYPSDASWLRVLSYREKGERFDRMCEEADFPRRWPEVDPDAPDADQLAIGMMCDQYTFNWTGIVAASDDAPDLVITEFIMTDVVQHRTGYKSDLSHWSVAQADMLVGTIMERLRTAGVEDQWNIAIMSDHGHSAIESGIRPQAIIPGTPMISEGSILLVVPRDADHLKQITGALAEYGAEPYHTDYVPTEYREHLAAFVAPPGVSFDTGNPNETDPTGRPENLSSHGLRPGMPGDDRFAVFAGPDLKPGVVESADAVQVAPTLAALLGLSVGDFPAAPIF